MRRAWGTLVLVVVLAACGGAATPTAPPEPTLTVAVPTRQPPTATQTTLPSTTTAEPSATVAASATEPKATRAGATDEPPTPTPTPDPAVAIILSYLEARAAADVTLVTSLSCPAWRSSAMTEAISFRSMNAKLEDVNCEATGADAGFTLVACGGKIVTQYGPDTREWDLSNQIYRAAPEAGEWKMCGYQ